MSWVDVIHWTVAAVAVFTGLCFGIMVGVGTVRSIKKRESTK